MIGTMGNHDRGLAILFLTIAAAALLGLLASTLAGCAPHPRLTPGLVVRGPASYWCFAATARGDGEGLLGCAGTRQTCLAGREAAALHAGRLVAALGPCQPLVVRP